VANVVIDQLAGPGFLEIPPAQVGEYSRLRDNQLVAEGFAAGGGGSGGANKREHARKILR
jgi:hypothetical protein